MADGEKRVALVTGASRGIGAAICEELKSRGWRVVGADLAPEHDASSVDRFFGVDLADPAQIEALAASVAATEGRLDALIHCAAEQHCGEIERIDLAAFDRTMAVNLRAPFWLTRAALPLLRASRGAVVNIGSVHAIATSRGISAYAASKGGLCALTRALALELAPDGVRVNALLPGATDTAMLRAGLRRGLGPAEGAAERFEEFSARHPMKRVAAPREVARAALFLADAETSSYVTGASLVVDGGVTAWLSTE